MLGDILVELFWSFIGEPIGELIIGLILLVVYGISKSIKWIGHKIAAATRFASVSIISLFKNDKTDKIMEEPNVVSELSSDSIDDMAVSGKYNDCL